MSGTAGESVRDIPAVLGPIIDRVPELHGARRVWELPGGLTNRNYAVQADSGRYVVRIAGHGELLAIDRDHDHHNSVAAASTGVGAPVIARLARDDVLVVGFIDGQTLTAERVREPGMLPRIATACRTLHAGPRFAGDFDMVRVLRRYLRICQDHDFPLPSGYLAQLPWVARIEVVLAAAPVAPLPCHNDLLAANLIDDGVSIRIIDYEYSGNNDPCFELGNLAFENELDADGLAELSASYWGAELPAKLARSRVQGLLGQYGWTLWACIQQATSDLDFDFRGWGMAKYETAVRAFTDPGFEGLLDAVGRAG